MAKLNIKMTYPVPDRYLSQSTAAGNTATLDYLGPDTIWVQVMKDGPDKGKWNLNPIPNYDKLPQQEDKLADGTVYYSRPANGSIPPDHVWNPMKCTYNFDTKEWDLVLRTPKDFGMPTSWDEVREYRDMELELLDVKSLLPEGPEKAAWDAYRQELRDIPQTYADAEIHTIPHPDSPEEIKNNARRAAEGEE